MIGDDTTLSIPGAPPRIDRELVAGRRIGRYELTAKLGAGGMGVVWEARDLELDRRVAIKVVRSAAADEAQRNLRREAQAMARLSHSAVVPVFDIGVFADQVYVVMELIEGRTLKEVLRDDELAWRRIVELFIACGRGLAAAHSAGIIHRDFKPGNVLVSTSGAVKVTDFGLAQLADAPDGELALGTEPTGAPHGQVAGTPHYMAPEQRHGRATEKSDQYAFCLALEEKLAGAPAAVIAAVKRGRAKQESERWPSMQALLGALERALGRRRRIAIGAGGGAVAIAMGAVVLVARSRGGDPCGDIDTQLDGTWDPTMRTAVERALNGGPRGAEIARRTTELLDRRAGDWVEARTTVCKAASRGELPANAAAARVACLDRRRDELLALARLLAEPNADIRERAIGAADSSARVDECQYAGSNPTSPDSPAVIAVRAQLADAKARGTLTLPGATTALQRTIEAANAIGASSVAADAYLALAGNPGVSAATSRDALEHALRLAGELHDDLLFARAIVSEIQRIGTTERHFDEALALRPRALAALAAAGSPPKLEVKYHHKVGKVLLHADRLDEAWDELQRALALETSSPSPRYGELAQLYYALGQVADARGDLDTAVPLFERSLAQLEESEGKGSPNTAFPLQGLTPVLTRLGQHERALAMGRRVVALFEASQAPESLALGRANANLAVSLSKRGHHDEAHALFGSALTLVETGLGPSHSYVGEILSDAGEAEIAAGHAGAGLEMLRRAVGIQRQSAKGDHAVLADALSRLALAEAMAGDARAVEDAREALEIFERTERTSQPLVAAPLIAMGAAQLASGQARAAVSTFERALKVERIAPPIRARASLLLARALWEDGTERARAIALARDAAVTLAEDEQWRSLAQSWLTTHQ